MNNFEVGPYNMPEASLGEKVDKLLEMQRQNVNSNEKKPKSFRMPFKGKLGKAKLKRGYVTVEEIAENNVINFRKEPIIEGTIKLNDTYHDIDDLDILIYKGKPLVILPKKSKFPYNPNRKEVKNNTYAQKHIQSRMLNEAIEGAKKKLGIAGMSIGGIILVAVIAYAFIAG